MPSPSKVTPRPLTGSQLQAVGRYASDVNSQLSSLLDEERRVLGHTLSRLAITAYPATTTVTVHDLRIVGIFRAVTCEVDGEQWNLSIEKPLASALISMLNRLPPGSTTAWTRSSNTIELDAVAALTFDNEYPFRPVQEQIVMQIEDKTGRSVRRVEIESELWDNGYFYSDYAEVDYSDGDSDTVALDDMPEWDGELRRQIGAPGPLTLVTINCTANGTTLH